METVHRALAHLPQTGWVEVVVLWGQVMVLVGMILRVIVAGASVSVGMAEADSGFEVVTRELDVRLVPAHDWTSQPPVLVLLLPTSAFAPLWQNETIHLWSLLLSLLSPCPI